MKLPCWSIYRSQTAEVREQIWLDWLDHWKLTDPDDEAVIDRFFAEIERAPQVDDNGDPVDAQGHKKKPR